MRKLTELRDDLELLEQDRLRVEIEIREKTKEYISSGIFRYTRDKRTEIIVKACECQLPQTIIEELTCCHEKWEQGDINVTDIDLFALYEEELFDIIEEKDGWMGKFNEIFFGGL